MALSRSDKGGWGLGARLLLLLLHDDDDDDEADDDNAVNGVVCLQGFWRHGPFGDFL